MKIAIVGCGQFADAHIQEARRISGVHVLSVCDMNVHMAQQAARRFHIPTYYTDLETMLRECKPDVVHITSPPGTHMTLGKLALQHGCHLYVEKPFTVNAEEAEELLNAAGAAGRFVCVGHSSAFDDAFVRLKALHQEGVLGDVVHVDAVMGYDLSGGYGAVFMGDPTHWLHRLPGGLAQNNISHPLSLMLEFIKDDKPAIHARGYRRRTRKFGDVRDEFFDELRVLIAGERTTGHMLFSAHARPVQLYVVVHGTKQQATASLDARTVRLTEGASMPGPFRKVQWAAKDVREARREYRRQVRNLLRARLHYFQGLHDLMSRFYSAIEGKCEMPIPMSEAYRTTAIMDEIFGQCRQNDPAAPGGAKSS